MSKITKYYEKLFIKPILYFMLCALQLLPQYRQLDRAKKKEKYEESLSLIQELIDCDDFEDISTLRVSLAASPYSF
jgi:hypothetical protein